MYKNYFAQMLTAHFLFLEFAKMNLTLNVCRKRESNGLDHPSELADQTSLNCSRKENCIIDHDYPVRSVYS